MRIGILFGGAFGAHYPGDGRRIQIYRQAEALESLGHEVVRMNPWHTMEREKIDVLHIVEGGLGNFIGMKEHTPGYRRIALAPFIDSNQSFFAYRLASRMHLGWRLISAQYVLRQQAKWSDVVIARSTHERERFIRSLGVPPEKIAIVLNGVDVAQVGMSAAEARNRLNLPDRFVLHVSIFTEARKNVVRLIEATESLKLPLIIAGTVVEGPMLEQLRRMAAQSAGRVRLLGFLDRDTLLGLYAACDVFALPSTHEGTGLVALEAAACGAKVVITRHGGPPDYFGKWAQYVEPSRVDDIRAGIQTAWNEPRSTALADHVRTLTWANSARQLVAAYAQ